MQFHEGEQFWLEETLIQIRLEDWIRRIDMTVGGVMSI